MAGQEPCEDGELAPNSRDNATVAIASAASGSDAEIAAELQAICSVVHQHTGHDFSRYKRPTLLRRIQRRVLLHQCSSASDYLRLLERSPSEADELHHDLLIGVTQFFRDEEVFRALADEVLPALLRPDQPKATLRIWVPGCASGEEAYSLAILVAEQISRSAEAPAIQIFATDIDDEHLQTARQGSYPLSISEQVSPERLERYFVRQDNGYQILRELRAMCMFSEHSLIRDPPFGSLDLISCRNVLIYLGADLQRRLVPLLHYALRDGGYLLLGPSESLAAHADLFAPVNQRLRIFRRNDAIVGPALEFPLTRGLPSQPVPARDAGGCGAVPWTPGLLNHAFERMIIEDYAPPCAVANERGDILYMAGRIGRYLQVAAGQPSRNIGDLAQGAFRVELRSALDRAVRTRAKVIRDRLKVDLGGEIQWFRLAVRPLPGMPPTAGLYVLVLQPLLSLDENSTESADEVTPEQAIIDQLENDLCTAHADLQHTQQNLETATEELKGSNEELISTNEELKSANEELQTSQEELRAVNSQLEEMNGELESKVQELAEANSDLANLFASTQIATLFLDRQLRISRFTPAAADLLSLIEADVGRPIDDFKPRFADHDLVADARRVMSTTVPLERQVRSVTERRWFILRVLPYRSPVGTPTGVIATLVDVTALKNAEEAVRQHERLLRAVTEAAPEPVFLKDREGRILLANPATLAALGRAADQVLGRTARDFYEDPEIGEKIMQTEQRILQSGMSEVTEERVVTQRGIRTYLSTKAPFRDPEGNVVGLVGVSRDITERKRVEEALKEASVRVQLALHTARAATWDRDMASGKTIWSANAHELIGVSPETTISYDLWKQLVHPDDWGELESRIATALRERRLVDCIYRLITPKGDLRWINSVGQGIYDEAGKLVRVTGLWWDVTERVRLEADRQREQERLARAQKLESLATLARGIAHDFNNLLCAFFGNVTLAMEAQENDDKAEAHACLDDTLKTLDRARGLTQQLITFAKGGEPVRVSTDMATFVRETISFSLSGSNVQLNFRSQPGLWRCELDQTQIGQVIDNIVINARQAMISGGMLAVDLDNVDISTLSRSPASLHYVRLTMADNGPGIDPGILDRIFDPFFSTKSGNAGLGLATSHSIVQRHGGHIEVESLPGRGATFRVFLPALKTAASPTLPASAERVDLTGRRILIMDDQPVLCNITATILQGWGATVTKVSGGKAAMAEFEAARSHGRAFDLAILDLTIPGEGGGADVLAQMRAQDPDLGAIAASGYSDDPIMARPSAFGFDAAVPKPYSAQEMARALNSILKRQGA